MVCWVLMPEDEHRSSAAASFWGLFFQAGLEVEG